MRLFGERLKKLREEKHLSQEQLGNKFNVSQSSISSYEAGTKEPDQTTLIKLAHFFNVSTDYLLGYIDVKQQIKENPSQYVTCSEELQLLIRFRRLSQASQVTVLTLIDNLEIIDKTNEQAVSNE